MKDAHGAADFDDQVGKVAALGEPVRRALYRYVIAQPGPVGREQAASAVGVAHHAAKFHLDRLAAEGLLDAEYSRPPGRRGPGAGRPAKRYRRSTREVSVSLPARRYELAGRVMAHAIASAAESGERVTDALHDAATEEGRRLGELARARRGADLNPAGRGHAVSDVLADYGYEPQVDDDAITLVNCPFHHLARQHPELVCGMNLDLVRGLLSNCGPTDLHARLNPAPGRCCVTLDRPAKAPGGVAAASR